jgi:hypothetical protein
MRVITCCLLLYLVSFNIEAFPSGGVAVDSADTIKAIHSAPLDANDIEMYFSNNGYLAYNDSMPYNDRHGFFYPIDSGFALIYTAGLWLAAEVNGAVRVAVLDAYSEFAPGPHDHPSVEDSSIFHVYRIGSEDGDMEDQDYDDWPVEWGAPVDSLGQPLLTGEQSIWTVFNDGDVTRHDRRGGSTAPLGAEVQLYAYSYSNSGTLDRMVFLDYTIINKSQHDWHDFKAAILADPDIGESADDMGATDSALSFVYCYSFEHDANFPPRFSPVVGVMMLDSPSSENGGAISGSSNVLVNFYNSSSLDMTKNIMSGKDLSGNDYIDPVTGNVTRYPINGDPRSGTGWLDFGKGDRRIMITSAPIDIAAGDTTHLSAAFLAAWGEDNFEALVTLYELAKSASDFHNHGCSGLEIMKNVRDGSIHSVSFTPPEQMWCSGRDWGGSAFRGGVGWAGELWGTSLERNDNVDVEFVFEPQNGQKAYRFTEDNDAYRFADYVTVPFVCRRASDSAALNVLFVDSDSDGEWTPSANAPCSFEFILVAQSEYSAEPLSDYTNAIFPNDALESDLMYAVSLGVRPRYARHNIRANQQLLISVKPEGDMQSADTVDFGDVIVGHEKSVQLRLVNEYGFGKEYEFSIDTSESFTLRKLALALRGGDTCQFDVTYVPEDTVLSTATLTISTREYNMPVYKLVLTGAGLPWPLAGDIYANGVLDLIDVSVYMRYLYLGYDPPNRGVRLDLDGSGDATLLDLVMLIQTIYPAR